MDVASPERPQHRRNASSKTGIWKALVSSKPRPETAALGTSPIRHHTRTESVPLLTTDRKHATEQVVFGERQYNAQARPALHRAKRAPADPSKNNNAETAVASKPHGKPAAALKKPKSTANLSSVFAKLNRSHKDLSSSTLANKENSAPLTPDAFEPSPPPIWAQFATTASTEAQTASNTSSEADNIRQEIAKYTPQEYSPSRQRNFSGTFEQPCLKPTLGNSRSPSAYSLLTSEGIARAIGRRVSGGRPSLEVRKSGDSARKESKEYARRVSGDKINMIKRANTERKVSGSSTEQDSLRGKLNIVKRGGRVMAAVAALQGRGKEDAPAKDDTVLDEKAVNDAFEAVLSARNIPEPMRRKMRTLAMRIKADFVKQDQEQSKMPSASSCDAVAGSVARGRPGTAANDASNQSQQDDDKETSKRSRARSRTFTFSKSDKRGNNSPTKRQRSGSKSRPTSIHIPKDVNTKSATTPTTPNGSIGRSNGPPAIPATYLNYLREAKDPAKVEVGRLHKLRILLRNETVTWVNNFVSHGGMTEIINLLNRTMAVEWREDHEDQVLHEALLCLKALCTAECAIVELDKVADDLFPALLAMLFDDEKKGPAEYSTRTIIVNVLFNFLASATAGSAKELESRARRILSYLGEPQKPDTAQHVDFVLDMHIPRPYKLWCREVTHVTKEVFWIFLHHLNVVSQPKSDPAADPTTCEGPVSTYLHRHFPGARAPVPAAPYIGGVEWDATTYLAAHIDLLNGLVASLPTANARCALRAELQMSGFEKVMGGTLRTCKEKFYAGVHDALRVWVAAAQEDGWETLYVREGPTDEERAERALRQSPKKKTPKNEAGKKVEESAPPKLDALPQVMPNLGLEALDVNLNMNMNMNMNHDGADDDDEHGWIG